MSDVPTRRASDFVPPKGISWAQISAAVGVVIVVLSFIGTLGVWLTGGIHPQWASDIDGLKTTIATLRNDLTAATTRLDAAQQTANTAGASERAALTQKIDANKEALTTKIDANKEALAQKIDANKELFDGRLNGTSQALEKRVSDQEYATKDLAKQVQSLTTVPSPAARLK